MLPGAAPRRGFVSGWLFGIGFFGILLNWVHGVLATYTSLPGVLTAAIWLLLVAYLALYPAMFGAIVAVLGRRLGRSALVLAPVVWVGLEFARGRLLGGFPWGLAGDSRAGGLALMQAASVGGVELVSLLLVAVWCALAYWALPWLGGRLASGRAIPPSGRGGLGGNVASILVIASVACVAGLGAARLRSHPAAGEAWTVDLAKARTLPEEGTRGASTEAAPPFRGDVGAGDRSGSPGSGESGAGVGTGGVARPFRMALVQGGYGSDLDAEDARRALRDYLALSRLAARSRPDLIVWPESNAPFLIDGTPGFRQALEGLSRETGALVLLGGVGGDDATGMTNSAFVIGAEGQVSRYDKRHLVQYGEYVPLKGLFPFIRHFVPQAGEFRPGVSVGVVDLDDVRVGTSICYEMIFPEEIRLQAKEGAQVIVNLTNDSWYPRGGPWQHAQFAAMRAIETGRYVARAASTGLTMVVDPLGRELVTGPLGGPAIVQAVIPSGNGTGPRRIETLFVRGGDWAGKGCATITALALAFLGVGNIIDRRRSRLRHEPP